MHVSTLCVCLLGAIWAQGRSVSDATRTFIPFQLVNGTSTAEIISQAGNLDGPKLKPGVNDTTFDWWYFDAVSTTSKNESLTIVFYNSGPSSLGNPGGPLSVQISGVLANGTTFVTAVDATGGTTVENDNNNGIFSIWNGAGASFAGTSLEHDSPEYTVTVNNPAIGVNGTLNLRSLSPPHYPCDINRPGMSQEIIPNVYWSNAVPDAVATADFTIAGSSLRFTGNGYHDKNWGSTILSDTFDTWYWGHARLGPYSLVWFDTLTQDGKEHFSSWITKDGKILSQSCQPKSVIVRPWGDNSEYPPYPKLAAPSGYTIRYDLDGGSSFVANFTRENIQLSTNTYKRMTGTIVGGVEGGEQYEGQSLCEQFQY
ncbi:tyrosinase ustQ [Colletotrichum spaethianum]|uniref:Tyrosinase ustQ n=1 Tax=Colletotrichum spaethianum TaxID=700344 RepID=A0AA37PAS4_9PEZI|nr:tyrosinase ustQ [Colletotrichum spaethianum]GKT48754.1 tyrosinase ustQ [Colletotrichum spaethianum]